MLLWAAERIPVVPDPVSTGVGNYQAEDAGGVCRSGCFASSGTDGFFSALRCTPAWYAGLFCARLIRGSAEWLFKYREETI